MCQVRHQRKPAGKEEHLEQVSLQWELYTEAQLTNKMSFPWTSTYPWYGVEDGVGLENSTHVCSRMKGLVCLEKLSRANQLVVPCRQGTSWTEFFTFILVSGPRKYSFLHSYWSNNLCICELHARIAFVVAKSTKKWSREWKVSCTFERHRSWGRSQTKRLLLRRMGERENARSAWACLFSWKTNT